MTTVAMNKQSLIISLQRYAEKLPEKAPYALAGSPFILEKIETLFKQDFGPQASFSAGIRFIKLDFFDTVFHMSRGDLIYVENIEMAEAVQLLDNEYMVNAVSQREVQSMIWAQTQGIKQERDSRSYPIS